MKPETRRASVKQTAHYVPCSEETVRRWIRDGKIEAVRAGRLIRVDLDSVDAWLKPVSGGAA